ncbi:MAG: metallophosphoesterase family protein [Deltaproteobacteria bacterium]|nr:metallophosphoesterase family protein [Deltaproteobacteria bacterium]
MILALFADVHANLEAFTACLSHVKERSPDGYAFVGDLVGYGADPAAVVDIVRALADRGAVVVRGNHDAAVVKQGSDTMHAAAEEAIQWTRGQLSAPQLAFLETLPLTARKDDLFFVHGSAEAPADWIYVTDSTRAWHSMNFAEATYVLSGHVHEPVLYYTGASQKPTPFCPIPGVPIPVPRRRRWLAIIGAAGQPRDGNTAACYALLDTVRATLTFHRVPYDWPSAAAKIRAAGLPERFAARLGRGE